MKLFGKQESTNGPLKIIGDELRLHPELIVRPEYFKDVDIADFLNKKNILIIVSDIYLVLTFHHITQVFFLLLCIKLT